jgi:hypothetical protein
LEELRRYKAPPWIHTIISLFLEQRKASFRIINARATPKSLYMGVPQGPALSPLLFNIYTAHLLKTI